MSGYEDSLVAKLDVSRETILRFQDFVGELVNWNDHVNLVSKKSLGEIWTRHILDSAQIFQLRQENTKQWVDLGSGGGFPGIVVAIMAKEKSPDLGVTLIESDRRKAVFLKTVVSKLSLNAQVLSERIEEIPPIKADVISARALAPLKVLLGHALHHKKQNGIALFHKGASFRNELEDALEFWRFSAEEYKSITENGSVILKIGEIKRA